MFNDCQGNIIDRGDIIIYTESQGQRVASLAFGSVIGWTNKTIQIQELEYDLTPVLKREGYYQGTGEYYDQSQWDIQNNRPPREKQEFIQTGDTIAPPTRINNPRPDRLFVFKKI